MFRTVILSSNSSSVLGRTPPHEVRLRVTVSGRGNAEQESSQR